MSQPIVKKAVAQICLVLLGLILLWTAVVSGANPKSAQADDDIPTFEVTVDASAADSGTSGDTDETVGAALVTPADEADAWATDDSADSADSVDWSAPDDEVLPAETDTPHGVRTTDPGDPDGTIGDSPTSATQNLRMNGWEGANQLVAAFLSPTGEPFWTETQYVQFMEAAKVYWERESRGLVTFTYTPYKNVPVVRSAALCSKLLGQAADSTAQAYGYTSASAFWAAAAPRTHLVMIRPSTDAMISCPTWTATDRRQIAVSVDVDGPSAKSLQSLAHEIGHDFGLNHTGSARCPAGVVDGPFRSDGACTLKTSGVTDDHYNDFLTIMGNTNQSIARFGLSGWQKEFLGIVREGYGLATVASGNTTYQLRASQEAVAVGTPSSTALQAIKIVDPVGTATREYSVQYDQVAGGIAIRRIQKSDDPDAQLDVDHILLNPGQTLVGNRMVFAAGEVFTSDSGHFSLRVDQIAGATATIRIAFGTALAATTPAAAADDYPSTEATAYAWNAAGQPTLTGRFETATDEDWFTFTAPTTGLARIAALEPVGSVWLEVPNKVQALASASTAGDMAITLPVTAGQTYTLKAAPSYVAPTILANVYTLKVTFPDAAAVQLSQTAWTASPDGGTTTVKVTAAGGWTVDVPSGYGLTVTPTSGASGTSFTVTAAANTLAGQRTGSITVRSADGHQAEFKVTQAKADHTVLLMTGAWELRKDGRYLAVPAGWPLLANNTWTAEAKATSLCGGRFQNNTGANWTATASAAWLHPTPTTGGAYTDACVGTDANTTGQSRTGSVTWKVGGVSWTLTVTQVATATFAVNATEVTLPATGGLATVDLTMLNDNWIAWVERNNWLKVVNPSGRGSATITVSAPPNPGAERYVYLQIAGTGETGTVTVRQAALTSSPVGTIDQVSNSGSNVTVSGWALDPNQKSAAVDIIVTVGGPRGSGEEHALGQAKAERADLADIFPGYGTAHGFSGTFATQKSGSQTVYIYAVNVAGTQGSDTLLGTRQITLPAASTPDLNAVLSQILALLQQLLDQILAMLAGLKT
ncbi:MAG: BACON domain-containing protein [Propionibacteriaceae bacterium]|nr:BACON domain-containing protein [Propionibacteriaceae bacterium]